MTRLRVSSACAGALEAAARFGYLQAESENPSIVGPQ